MKDLLPTLVMNKPATGQMPASEGLKTAAQSSQTALFGGLMTGSNDAEPLFADSLKSSLRSTIAHQDAVIDGLTGGKTLPLAAAAADFGPLSTPSDSTDLQLSSDITVQTEMAILPGLSSAMAITAAQDGAQSPSAAAAAAVTGTMSPHKTVLADLAGVDNNQAIADSSRLVKPAVTSQTIQLTHQADVTNSPEIMLARLQLASSESTPNSDGQRSDLAARATIAARASTVSTADVQSVLKSDAVVNETDLLFNSRMQQGAVNQPAELAGQRPVLETLLSTTQMTSNESLQASIARSPIIQSSGIPESPATSAATMQARSNIMEAFGKPEWGQGMGKQVLWMVNQNISRAEIRLNPANLGPLEVRIDMENDQVNVAFSSRHADVREAVEQAMPRLREMLEDKGLNLSDTDVSQHSFAEQQERAFGRADQDGTGFGSNLPLENEADQLADSSHQVSSGNGASYLLSEGLVDYYI